MSLPYNNGDWLLCEFYRKNGKEAVPVRMVGRDHAQAHAEHMTRLDELRNQGFTVVKETCGDQSCRTCRKETYMTWRCTRGKDVRIVCLIRYLT